MALLELLGAGVIAWAIGSTIKDTKETKRRRETPMCYDEGITEEDFSNIVSDVSKKIKRLKSLYNDGPIVYGVVESQSGISEWNFSLDFNDYGHFTTKYWTTSDNKDSNIPERVGKLIHDGMAYVIGTKYGSLDENGKVVIEGEWPENSLISNLQKSLT